MAAIVYTFTSECGSKTISISESDFQKYPNSLLPLIWKKSLVKDKVKTLITSKNLEMIEYFYKNDKWPNPIVYTENILSDYIDDPNNDRELYDLCRYCNLPLESVKNIPTDSVPRINGNDDYDDYYDDYEDNYGHEYNDDLDDIDIDTDDEDFEDDDLHKYDYLEDEDQHQVFPFSYD